MLLLRLVLLLKVLSAGVLGGVAITGNDHKIETRIHNGTLAKQGQFNFIVYIESTAILTSYEGAMSTQKQRCTGFVVSPKYVLTAAHCFVFANRDRIDLVVRVVTDLSRWPANHEANMKTAAKLGLTDIVVHLSTWSYLWTNGEFGQLEVDVALLRLHRSLTFGQTLGSIPLMRSEFPSTVRKCVALGLGLTEEQILPPALHYTEVTAGNSGYCRELMPRGSFPETRLCATGTNGISNVCSGDSGSPLVCRTEEGFVATGVAGGILAKFDKCNADIKASVYLSMNSIAEWIEDQTMFDPVDFIDWE